MPFVNSNLAVARIRTVPNYEFVNGRLRDQDGDGIPSYFDPIDQTPGPMVGLMPTSRRMGTTSTTPTT